VLGTFPDGHFGPGSGSIYWFILGSCCSSWIIVFYQNRKFNSQYFLFACFAVCDMDYSGIHVFLLIYCIFAYQGVQSSSYVLEYPCDVLISKYAWPRIVDDPLTLIFRMRQGECRCSFGPWRLPISHSWMSATNQNLHHPRCKAQYPWRCVDTHSLNGAVTVLLSLIPMTAANTSVMHNGNQINLQLPYLQDQKSLILHWHLFLVEAASSLTILAKQAANTSILG